MAADPIRAAAGGNLAPTAPTLVGAVAGGNLAPTAPGLTSAVAGGNLAPGAPFLASAAAGGNLAPAVPGLTSGAAAGNLTPTAPELNLAAAGPVMNYLETAFDGTNNDLRFTQRTQGSPPTIQFLMNNSGSNSVTVTGSAILIHLRQTFGSFYLTAANIKAMIDDSAAAALVAVTYPAGNNGTGVIASPATNNISFGPTALAGGDALPTAPGIITAHVDKITPAAPGLTQAAAGGNLAPTAPGGITP